MTIRQIIAKLTENNLENRLNKLIEIGAPQIVVDSTAKALEDIKAGKIKVNGLERKHRIAADAVVTELAEAEAVGNYYKKGKRRTLVLKMVTSAGTYYYDYQDNKIGSSFNELSVFVPDNQFAEIQLESIA